MKDNTQEDALKDAVRKLEARQEYLSEALSGYKNALNSQLSKKYSEVRTRSNALMDAMHELSIMHAKLAVLINEQIKCQVDDFQYNLTFCTEDLVLQMIRNLQDMMIVETARNTDIRAITSLEEAQKQFYPSSTR